MKEFFLILLFSKTVLLTPEVITISGVVDLVPEEPVSAITQGAGIDIDLARFAPEAGIRKLGLIESQDYLERLVPPDSVRATLIDSDGVEVQLDLASFALQDDRAWLVISSSQGVPTGVDFVAISIQSDTILTGVKVYWRNFSK